MSISLALGMSRTMVREKKKNRNCVHLLSAICHSSVVGRKDGSQESYNPLPVQDYLCGFLVYLHNLYKVHNIGFFIRKPEGKRWLGILRHRWEDSIKMGLK
jgi:hypothetical protein